MSHTVCVNLIADQEISVAGVTANVHDIRSVVVDSQGVIREIVLKSVAGESPAMDLCCNNCEASRLIKIPKVGAKSESDYMGFVACRQKLSDHHRHLVVLQHVCAWHSEYLKKDERYNKLPPTLED